MTDREWNMNDQEFDALLEHSVPDPPPDDIAARVTPWKTSMTRVLVGLALTAITLNFLLLNHILPAIGIVLQLLGLRTLRRENRWFRAGFVVSVLRAICFFPQLILNTTILQSALPGLPLATMTTAIHIALLFVELVALWRGLVAVQRKAGLPPHAGSTVALLVWYAIVYLLALVQYRGLILILTLLVSYFFILRSLYRLSKELDQACYAIRPAPVRVTDRRVVLLLLSLLLAGFVCGYAFGGSYPMEWTPLDESEHAQVQDVKAQLLAMGFPSYVLNDLTAQDIAACDNALEVFVETNDNPLNDGGAVALRVTNVGVRVPGERERWVIFHHFLWPTDPGFYGTESIQIWPVYRDISEGWSSAGEVTGRVLCDQNGAPYAADYYFLGPHTFTSNSIFWGEQTATDVFANFSMPRSSDRQRGYLAYPIEEVRDGYIISSWFNYTHQQTWSQYPAVTAMEHRMTATLGNAGAFRTIQDALQFWPTEKGAKPLS